MWLRSRLALHRVLSPTLREDGVPGALGYKPSLSAEKQASHNRPSVNFGSDDAHCSTLGLDRRVLVSVGNPGSITLLSALPLRFRTGVTTNQDWRTKQ